MNARFRRVGVDFAFAPAEVPVQLRFERVRDRGDEVYTQVAVLTAQGEPVITRHVNLMTGPTRGAMAELVKELHEINTSIPMDVWKTLMREAGESVIRAHRKGRPIETIEGAIERPAPPAWLCRGLLLKHKPNCWLGAASTGKSTLAKAMCAYYASGYRFLDREMEKGVPLYLDWEDDLDSFARVVYDVCRNLGVYPLPKMHWRDMHGYRLRDQVETLAALIDRERIGLIVLDAVAAAGGSTGEHMTWEAVALELEQCLGALPPVTVLALDHVTGAEHRNGGTVPIKARGAERKLEYYRNQWTLMPDERAAQVGRHVINWHHTKLNVDARERPFATEIVHRESEISVLLRPMEVMEDAPQEDTKAARLLAELATTSGRSARELALQVDGHEPSPARVKSVRKTLDRAEKRGEVERLPGDVVRFRTRRQVSSDGTLIPFPGTPA